jgi:hypothetical protein
MSELRERFAQRIQQKKVSNTPRPATVADDEIFIQGVQWLDSLAGVDFPQDGAKVTFSHQVWKSEARSGDA